MYKKTECSTKYANRVSENFMGMVCKKYANYVICTSIWTADGQRNTGTRIDDGDHDASSLTQQWRLPCALWDAFAYTGHLNVPCVHTWQAINPDSPKPQNGYIWATIYPFAMSQRTDLIPIRAQKIVIVWRTPDSFSTRLQHIENWSRGREWNQRLVGVLCHSTAPARQTK